MTFDVLMDTANIVHSVMPSDQYEDLTVPSTGDSVIMPADGWLQIVGVANSNNARLVLEELDLLRSGNTNDLYSPGIDALIPVRKGSEIRVTYGNVNIQYFRLVYPIGSVPTNS